LPVSGPRSFGGVSVAALTLTEFRCYRRAAIEVDERPVVLTGPNGAGKTNLLEAISFLVPGRGLRQAKLSEIDHRVPAAGNGAAQPLAWGVAARIERPDGAMDVGTGRDPDESPGGREKRLVKINGALAGGQTGLAEILAIVWLIPQMDRLFLDGAAGRRRFLDRLVASFDPDHAKRLARYNHALQERAQLLARPGGSGADGNWLDAIETQIAEHGIAITAARIELAGRLTQVMASDGSPFPKAELAVTGDAEEWLAALPALAAEDRLRTSLAESRRRDAESGHTQFGPHRSDLQATHLAKRLPAALCSTGEQKALLIAMVLAHGRLLADCNGAAPVLLLDEIVAHLDAARRRALFEAIVNLGIQAWLTGTDEETFQDLRGHAQFLRVRDAVIQEA
jgi:DNA replication and repair protein RecF